MKIESLMRVCQCKITEVKYCHHHLKQRNRSFKLNSTIIAQILKIVDRRINLWTNNGPKWGMAHTRCVKILETFHVTFDNLRWESNPVTN